MGPAPATVDLAALRQWIGRSECVQDTITPRLEASLRAILDRAPGQPIVGEPASIGIHWCLAAPIAPTTSLGDDGHPRRGGFMPPVPLPRRMWAGGELALRAPLLIGDLVTRTSRIEDITLKEGRSGPLCFVTVHHTWATARGIAIDERHDTVYRASEVCPPSTPARSSAPQPTALWQQSWPCNAVLLFRYSALTFNGHRIHYDHAYVTEIEGYPNLVVHGPLQATALIALAREACGETPLKFSFRGVAPLFADGPFTAKACREREGLHLWVCDRAGRTTMTGGASW